MLVTDSVTCGTIGGGALEWHAVQAARALLGDAASPSIRESRLVLGRELGQCCGGVVQLWLEKFTRADLPLLRNAVRLIDANASATWVTEFANQTALRRLLPGGSEGMRTPLRVIRGSDTVTLHERIEASTPPVWIYGAGHVGQALVRALIDLPLQVTWIDSRLEFLPADVANSVRVRHESRPVESVRDAPPGTRFLVLTHDHALDYELCRAILQRGDFAWLGVIGSKSKGARFRSRLARDGMTPEVIARMVSPIGVPGIASKWPAAIAIGVVAQLLQTLATPRPQFMTARDDDSDCSAERCETCVSHKGSSH